MHKEMMFISESVTEGHPDKLCDQICDAVVDQFLIQDPHSRILVECAVSSAILFIAANFSSEAKVDLAYVARKVIRRIGYDQPDFNPNGCSILTAPRAKPVDRRARFETLLDPHAPMESIPAKNQVTLFGFACDQSPSLLPLPIDLAHRLARRLAEVRKTLLLPYLSPDGKVQVGVTYRHGVPHRIYSVTVTANQRERRKPSLRALRNDIREGVIEPVFADAPLPLHRQTRIHVNPDGAHLGGPTRHSGLSGRKNAIDTYGEYCRHSGKALSGKDPLRIDRVGAYAARHAAKNVVAAGLAPRCEIMLSYSIGKTGPVSLQVRTGESGKRSDAELADLVARSFDFRLAGIIRRFDLLRQPALRKKPFYETLAAYGHVGREDLRLPWEETDTADQLSGSL